MALGSNMEWTNSTWNSVTGCTKMSSGCQHCYAECMAHRLQGTGLPQYTNGFRVTLHPETLELPLHWKKPQTVFVNSMSDLFHDDIPDDFVFGVFDVMRRASWHTFQILTKRSRRLARLDSCLEWAPNIWMGVSVEAAPYKFRIANLTSTGARVKFLSLEPLLGDLGQLHLQDIDWTIAGGESGPGARPVDPDWVRSIRDQSIDASVPFFFKQWGGVHKKVNGRNLDGRTWDELPHPLTGQTIVVHHHASYILTSGTKLTTPAGITS
jgi:protein gp37